MSSDVLHWNSRNNITTTITITTITTIIRQLQKYYSYMN